MIWRIAAVLAGAAFIYGAYAANEDWSRHHEALEKRATATVDAELRYLKAMKLPPIALTVEELTSRSQVEREALASRFLEVRGRLLDVRAGKARVGCVLATPPRQDGSRAPRIECWFSEGPDPKALAKALSKLYEKGEEMRLIGYFTGFQRNGMLQLSSARFPTEGE